jgi:hypothetical protein
LFFYSPCLIQKHEKENSINVRLIDQRFGFNNVKLETHKSDFSNLIFISAGENHVETYIKENDPKEIGILKLDTIRYSFYKDKLFHISVEPSGNYHELESSLKESYGKPVTNKENIFFTNNQWEGEKVKLVLIKFNTLAWIADKIEKEELRKRGSKILDMDKLLGYDKAKPIVLNYYSKKLLFEIELDKEEIQKKEKNILKKAF